MAELIDYLTDEEIETIAEFVKDSKAVVTGKGALANEVSRIIKKAPKTETDTVIYRYLKPRKEWAGTGEFKEPGFVVGSDTELPKKNGATLFKITVPAGQPVVWLPGGAYLADRGPSIVFDGTRGETEDSKADVYATVKAGKAMVASVQFNTGWIPSETEKVSLEQGSDDKVELHLIGEHDQKTHGSGGVVGGRGHKHTKEEIAARRSRRRKRLKATKEVLGEIADVAKSLGAIAIGAGFVAYIIKSGEIPLGGPGSTGGSVKIRKKPPEEPPGRKLDA